MTETIERSAFVASLTDVELRESGNGKEFTLAGHAAVFNSWSEDLGFGGSTFRERIAEGAFTQVLKSNPDVRLLFNHDGMTLARTKSGTLDLTEDDQGLKVWARLSPDMQIARDLRAAMQRGDIDQMSFAFTVAEDDWHEDHDTDEIERTITRIGDLFDVSVVSFPAYPDTDAAIREIRAAAAAGKIAAQDDPADDDTDTDAAPADDPADPVADPLAALRAASAEAAGRERESYKRLLQEITK